jgi:hypothetical protein
MISVVKRGLAVELSFRKGRKLSGSALTLVSNNASPKEWASLPPNHLTELWAIVEESIDGNEKEKILELVSEGKQVRQDAIQS